jgi:hypothetical protein
MNTGRGTIANLHIKANLMSNDYQSEFGNVSVFELADIKRRSPMLPICLNPTFYDNVTPAQRRQWDAHLFWGDKQVRMSDVRRLRWLEAQAAELFASFGEVVDRLGEEQAFEILYIAVQVRRSSSSLAAEAARIAAEVLRVLQGEVFGHTVATIEQRLAAIAGEPGLRLELPHGHRTDQDRS